MLFWNHYVVPQWTYSMVRTARWDRFGQPTEMPRYGAAAFPTVWWWDAQRARKDGIAVVSRRLTRREALALGAAAVCHAVLRSCAPADGGG